MRQFCQTSQGMHQLDEGDWNGALYRRTATNRYLNSKQKFRHMCDKDRLYTLTFGFHQSWSIQSTHNTGIILITLCIQLAWSMYFIICIPFSSFQKMNVIAYKLQGGIGKSEHKVDFCHKDVFCCYKFVKGKIENLCCFMLSGKLRGVMPSYTDFTNTSKNFTFTKGGTLCHL